MLLFLSWGWENRQSSVEQNFIRCFVTSLVKELGEFILGRKNFIVISASPIQNRINFTWTFTGFFEYFCIFCKYFFLNAVFLLPTPFSEPLKMSKNTSLKYLEDIRSYIQNLNQVLAGCKALAELCLPSFAKSNQFGEAEAVVEVDHREHLCTREGDQF